MNFHLLIRNLKGFDIETDVEFYSTVGDLKTKISLISNKPFSSIILVYRGQVLDDERTLLSYKLFDNPTLYVTYRNTKKGVSSRYFPKSNGSRNILNGSHVLSNDPNDPNNDLSDPNDPNENYYKNNNNLLNNISNNNNKNTKCSKNKDHHRDRYRKEVIKSRPVMRNPFSQSIMKLINDNPQLYVDMMQSNPAFHTVAESNPQLQHMINDPELLSEQFKLITSPENMEQAARTLDRMLDTVESLPGGFQALTKHYTEFQDPLMNGIMEQMRIAETIVTNLDSKPPLKPSEDPLPVYRDPFFGSPFDIISLFNHYQFSSQNSNVDDGFCSPIFANNNNNSNSNSKNNNNNSFNNEINNNNRNKNDYYGMKDYKLNNDINYGSGTLNDGLKVNLSIPNYVNIFSPKKKNNNRNPSPISTYATSLQMQAIFIPPPRPAMDLISMGIEKCMASGLDVAEIPGFRELVQFCRKKADNDVSTYAPIITDECETEFASQLKEMNDLGFNDNERNIEALIATNGNVHLAIDWIFSQF